MTRPYFRRRPPTWFSAKVDPPPADGLRVLGCIGRGRHYTVFETIRQNGRWLTLDGREVEPEYWMHRPEPPKWNDLKDRIEQQLGIKPGAIEAYRNGRKADIARKVFCWMAYMRHGQNLIDIARACQRHHTTILHHIRHVEQHFDAFAALIDRVQAAMEADAKSQ